MTLSLFILAAASSVVATHDVRVEHHGGASDISYAARTDVTTRTIGSSAPTRADARRCRWTANVVVERTPRDMPNLTRVISRDQTLSGNLPGTCNGKDKMIDREIAARHDEVQSHLAAVAQKDSSLLLAEINAARQLASN